MAPGLLALPASAPTLRAAAAILVVVILVKTLQRAAGHERPRGLLDLVLFLVIPAVARWEGPRRPDRPRAVRDLLTGLLQLGLALALREAVLRLDARSPIQLLTTQLGLYLVVAGACNLSVVALSLRGLDHDDPFDSPLLSRTPSEFWGRRWNTWVNHVLYRYVFLPAGGRRHPVRGTMAAFAVSGAAHEVFADVGTRALSGWMGLYFLVQGLVVVATSRSPGFRRLARRAPLLTWAVTLTLLAASGVLLVRGADGVDPSQAWSRCCASAP